MASSQKGVYRLIMHRTDLRGTFALISISFALSTPGLAQGIGGGNRGGLGGGGVGSLGGGSLPGAPNVPVVSPMLSPTTSILNGGDKLAPQPTINGATPQTYLPPLVFGTQSQRPVPLRKGLNEHRGQGDVGTSTTIKAIAKSEGQKGGGGNPNAKMPDGSMKAVWGAEAEVVACNTALVQLSVSGRIAGFKEPINRDQLDQEEAFLTDCLGAPDQRISPRLGRLVYSGATLCTVFFLTPTRALTARHCLYERHRSGGVLSLEPLAPSMKTLSVELGPVLDPKVFLVKAVLVPSVLGFDRLALTSSSGYALPKLEVATQDVEQRDYIAIELDSPITTDKLLPVSWTTPQFGDKVFLPAFHEPTRVLANPGDTGFRQQIAGYCQIVQPQIDRCMTHACSTTPGASGAPILVEREVGGSKELHLVGLHTSGKREDTGCDGNPQADEILNYGVRLSHQDLQQLQ